MEYQKHYIRIDADYNIIKGFSDAFEEPQPGDICITELGGRHFEMMGEVNPSLVDMRGVYLYKYVGGSITAKDAAEIEREIPVVSVASPTLEQRLRAAEAAFMEMAGEIYGKIRVDGPIK